jgi:hypothetical protein
MRWELMQIVKSAVLTPKTKALAGAGILGAGYLGGKGIEQVINDLKLGRSVRKQYRAQR